MRSILSHSRKRLKEFGVTATKPSILPDFETKPVLKSVFAWKTEESAPVYPAHILIYIKVVWTTPKNIWKKKNQYTHRQQCNTIKHFLKLKYLPLTYQKSCIQVIVAVRDNNQAILSKCIRKRIQVMMWIKIILNTTL